MTPVIGLKMKMVIEFSTNIVRVIYALNVKIRTKKLSMTFICYLLYLYSLIRVI